MTASVDVLKQLNDLPPTFTRPGAPYTQLVSAFNVGLMSFTIASDATIAQTFAASQYGWLDVWGAIFSIQRYNSEADGVYRLRVTRTLLAWVGTLPSIESWAIESLGVDVSVTENSGVGYNISFPTLLTAAKIKLFLTSLNRIRPAGVPFSVTQQQTGVYLDTVDYFDIGGLVGSYLTDTGTAGAPDIPALTNNTLPLLPEYYFSDPILNPGV